MTAPVDKREWLAERGLAIAGARGRFSLEAKEALAEAENAGVKFLEKGANVTTVTRIVDGEKVQEIKEVNPWAQHPDPIREGILTFGNGKGLTVAVNASEVCTQCQYSFGWCYCDVPTYRYWKTGEVLKFNG